jgi:hypothetical protein
MTDLDDATEVVTEIGPQLVQLAYSEEDGPVLPDPVIRNSGLHQSWGFAWGHAAILLACAGVVAFVIAVVGLATTEHHPTSMPAESPLSTLPPTSMPAAALPPAALKTAGPSAPGTTWTTPPPPPPVTVQAAPPPPAFSGRYTMTDTAPTGHVFTGVWDVTPCGDGCVDIAEDGGRDFDRQAQLINGQWTFDVPIKAICDDGSSVPSAGSGHFTIGASTLRGILQASWTKARCGFPAGDTVTHSIVLTRA